MFCRLAGHESDRLHVYEAMPSLGEDDGHPDLAHPAALVVHDGGLRLVYHEASRIPVPLATVPTLLHPAGACSYVIVG